MGFDSTQRSGSEIVSLEKVISFFLELIKIFLELFFKPLIHSILIDLWALAHCLHYKDQVRQLTPDAHLSSDY